MHPRNRQFVRLSGAARGLVLLALLAPALREDDLTGVWALLTIGVVWGLAFANDQWPRVPVVIASVMEAAAVGAICGVMIQDEPLILGALAVPPFAAGLFRGLRGVSLALAAQLGALLVAGYAFGGGLGGADAIFVACTWSMTGLGLGLVATFLHSSLEEPADPWRPTTMRRP